MQWYNRPNGAAGDSMTDIGALALIGGYDCAAHVRACQDADGRMRRHPTMNSSDYSRDHIVSLCFYTLWSGDKDPLSKFLSYTLKHGGRFCEGTIGQSLINPIVLSCCYSILGNNIKAALLDVVNIPVLLAEALTTPVGYRLILIAEVCLIKKMTTKAKIWDYILEKIYNRQPANMFYRALTGRISLQEAQEYCDNFPHALLGGVWHWNTVEPRRQATGVDLRYLPAIIRKI